MPLYTYKAINKTGKEVKGELNAETSSQAKSKIKTLGLMLLEIKERTSSSASKSSNPLFSGKVKITDLALMTRQLATLIKARIQIVESFSALIDQTDNPKLKVVLAEIKQKVNEGSSLANALKDYPKIFNNVYVNMVDAGESSGTLDVVLIRLADFTESQVKLKNKIRGAMTYPVIMIIIGSLMIGAIFILVIPKITKIFISLDKELPIQTELCIWFSNFLTDYWAAVIVLSFASFYFFKKWVATVSGKSKYDRVLLNIPVIKDIVIMVNVGRFCSTLATLLNSGVPILTAMNIVKNLVSNVHMQQAVDESRINIQEGASLVAPLISSGLFPPMVTHMIRLGERSGELEPMLQIVAENYDDQVNTKLSGLTSILEPIMMVAMGGVVGFIVFSVVIPMMEINSVN